MNSEISPLLADAVQYRGIDVYVNNELCINKEWVQFRFPKRKSKRVVKKWRKNQKNYKMLVTEKAVKIDRKLYVCQATYDAIKMLSNNGKD